MKRIPLLFAMAALLMSACIDIYDLDDPRMDDLRRAEREWRQSGIRDYNYEARFSSAWELSGKYWVKVRDGVVVEAHNISLDRPVNLNRTFVPTVEDLFDRIYVAIDDHYDEIEVYYDPEFGFPNYLYLDDRIRAVDDEYEVRVDKLTIFD